MGEQPRAWPEAFLLVARFGRGVAGKFQPQGLPYGILGNRLREQATADRGEK
jgi:hypothetical protein